VFFFFLDFIAPCCVRTCDELVVRCMLDIDKSVIEVMGVGLVVYVYDIDDVEVDVDVTIEAEA